MSRRASEIQKLLYEVIRRHGRPMTLGEIRTAILDEYGSEQIGQLQPAFDRLLRRSLYRMIGAELVASSESQRSALRSYFIHPTIIGMMSGTPEGDALMEVLKAQAGRGAVNAQWAAKAQEVIIGKNRRNGQMGPGSG